MSMIAEVPLLPRFMTTALSPALSHGSQNVLNIIVPNALVRHLDTVWTKNAIYVWWLS